MGLTEVIHLLFHYSSSYLYFGLTLLNTHSSPSPVRWTTFHLRWSFVCRPAGKRQGSCIQNKCRPMRRLTRFLNPPKLGIEQNIVQHAFDEIGYPALRAPLRRRASSHRIALSPGLRQAPHYMPLLPDVPKIDFIPINTLVSPLYPLSKWKLPTENPKGKSIN